jgi:hypothetical protein
MNEDLPAYLLKIFSQINVPAKERDWHFHAQLSEFRFSAFCDAVDQSLVKLSEHPRILAISIFASRAVSIIGNAITRGTQDHETFLKLLHELQIAIDNKPSTISADQIEILEHNITDRRQWVTPSRWLPAGHVIAILPPEILQLEILEEIAKTTPPPCPPST